MLTIVIPEIELYDEKNNEFTYVKEQTLKLEHSLISISKWESKWKKPFMERQTGLNAEKNGWTTEEFIDYVKCMTITTNVDDNVYKCIPSEELDKIVKYIQDEQTATWFSEVEGQGRSREVITSELIYYWMIQANIPFECEKWHLSRLITLIRIFSIKQGPEKKMSKSEIMARNRELNEQRKAKLKTKG